MIEFADDWQVRYLILIGSMVGVTCLLYLYIWLTVYRKKEVSK